jgi:hypothetical protein
MIPFTVPLAGSQCLPRDFYLFVSTVPELEAQNSEGIEKSLDVVLVLNLISYLKERKYAYGIVMLSL